MIHHAGASARQFRSQSFLNLWRSRYRLYRRFYGPMRRWLANRIVGLGMRAEIREARTMARSGEIGSAELSERVEAARQVRAMFTSGMREV